MIYPNLFLNCIYSTLPNPNPSYSWAWPSSAQACLHIFAQYFRCCNNATNTLQRALITPHYGDAKFVYSIHMQGQLFIVDPRSPFPVVKMYLLLKLPSRLLHFVLDSTMGEWQPPSHFVGNSNADIRRARKGIVRFLLAPSRNKRGFKPI